MALDTRGDERGVPIRRGVCKMLTLDFDAVEALLDLAPGPGAQGRVISELLRAEVSRREERARLRALRRAESGACDDE
jgi:hypothetical protein